MFEVKMEVLWVLMTNGEIGVGELEGLICTCGCIRGPVDCWRLYSFFECFSSLLMLRYQS